MGDMNAKVGLSAKGNIVGIIFGLGGMSEVKYLYNSVKKTNSQYATPGYSIMIQKDITGKVLGIKPEIKMTIL